MNRQELDKILELHKKWLNNKPEGIRANLSGANLSGANLSGANLFRADLSGANLSGVDLDFPIYQFYLGQYHIHTLGKYIRIGCQYLEIDEWLIVSIDEAASMGLKRDLYEDYMSAIRWYANKYKNNPELFKKEKK
jgi:hypothetical protein